MNIHNYKPAKDGILFDLMKIDGVVGAGFGTRDNQACIIVYTKENYGEIPLEIEGFKVIIEIVGEIVVGC